MNAPSGVTRRGDWGYPTQEKVDCLGTSSFGGGPLQSKGGKGVHRGLSSPPTPSQSLVCSAKEASSTTFARPRGRGFQIILRIFLRARAVPCGRGVRVCVPCCMRCPCEGMIISLGPVPVACPYAFLRSVQRAVPVRTLYGSDGCGSLCVSGVAVLLRGHWCRATLRSSGW